MIVMLLKVHIEINKRFLYDHNNFVVVVLCYWSVDKMISYLIGGVIISILALSVIDPWDRAPVWSNL
jgi:hypothetical protein